MIYTAVLDAGTLYEVVSPDRYPNVTEVYDGVSTDQHVGVLVNPDASQTSIAVTQ